MTLALWNKITVHTAVTWLTVTVICFWIWIIFDLPGGVRNPSSEWLKSVLLTSHCPGCTSFQLFSVCFWSLTQHFLHLPLSGDFLVLIAGLIETPKRNRLSDNNFEKLLTLKVNKAWFGHRMFIILWIWQTWWTICSVLTATAVATGGGGMYIGIPSKVTFFKTGKPSLYVTSHPCQLSVAIHRAAGRQTEYWRWLRPSPGKKRRVLRNSRPCYQDCWHTDPVRYLADLSCMLA